MMAHTTRALHLIMRAIAEVEDVDEIERLRETCSELYATDDATLRQLTSAIAKRTDDLLDRTARNDDVTETAPCT